jgi:hypothetical protein
MLNHDRGGNTMGRMFQLFWSSIIVCGLFFGTVSSAQSSVTLSATLYSDPVSYSGNCPGRITFKGKITLQTTTLFIKPIEVKYRFKRSDGAVDASVKTLIFNKSGSQDVIDSWDLGGSSLPTYCGWESIEIISPNSTESSKAGFSLVCGNVQQPALTITEMFSIPKGNDTCGVGFRIKNMGGATGDEYPQCIRYILEGTICNGTNCLSNQENIKNSKNPGGEDTYTDAFKPYLLDFSKPFSVKMRLYRKVAPSSQIQEIGSQFEMTKDLKCLVPKIYQPVPLPFSPTPAK